MNTDLTDTNLELLCPSGNTASLKSAIANGADAVYIGNKNFSARNYADNFEILYSAIEFAHKHKVKVYVALNTLVTDRNLKNWVKTAYDACNADAFIVQDLGGAKLLKKHLPQIPLHASTQMTVHNLYQCKTLEELGFTRVVLARELSYAQIKHITSNCVLQTEVFVHGALCYCYSGQCLMSSFIGARSANQGMCAQPCRLMYDLQGKKGYLLNTKDLCLIDHIQKLKEVGVTSLKIEGRMKNPFYVGVTAKLYKKAINGEPLTKEDRQMLNLTFNRGFTHGNFLGEKNIFASGLTKTKSVEEKGFLNICDDDITPTPTPISKFEIAKIILNTAKKTPLFAMQVQSAKQAKAVEGYADELYLPINSEISTSTKCVGVYPPIMQDVDHHHHEKYPSVLLTSFMPTHKQKYADFTFNVMNCHTLETLKNMGFARATLSLELTARQIMDMQVAGIQTEVVVYGRQRLMVSSYCPVNCDKTNCKLNSKSCLKDKTGASFPIMRNNKNCEISVYNSVPLFIADKINDIIADVYRLNFTTESPEECEKIAKIYLGKLSPSAFKGKYTRGHFYRGVGNKN